VCDKSVCQLWIPVGFPKEKCGSIHCNDSSRWEKQLIVCTEMVDQIRIVSGSYHIFNAVICVISPAGNQVHSSPKTFATVLQNQHRRFKDRLK
jgi:hypothetical protein